jgi:hypothetical protein
MEALRADTLDSAWLAFDDDDRGTRHYFAWYALNVLRLEPHEIAAQLGHKDGGKLVRELYGHADAVLARRRIIAAFDEAPPMPMPRSSARFHQQPTARDRPQDRGGERRSRRYVRADPRDQAAGRGSPDGA